MVVLWCLTDGLTEDGFLQYYGRREIDGAVGMRGFCAALEAVGWIELGDDGARLVNYGKHNGRSAKCRAETARRVGRKRARGVTGVKAVYSEEKPLSPDKSAAANGERFIGSISYVPSMAGLLLAGTIIQDILKM